MGRCWKGMCQVALLLASLGTAQAAIIPKPELPYGTDTVRLPDGFQCSSATSPSSYMDAGVWQQDEDRYGNRDRGVYVRVMIPLTQGVKRIDCSKLYEQALREREQNKLLDSIKEKAFAD